MNSKLTADGIRIARSEPLDPIGRLTAKHMLASHLESAPVTVLAEADATELVALRRRLVDGPGQSQDVRVSFTHLFVKIVAGALAAHPEMNATLNGDERQILEEINIGVALAMPGGNLIVPVLHGADQMSVMDIASSLADLEERALAKKLKPADMRRGTFTLTNGGMFSAIRWSTPILNQPQCAILGTGAITPTPVVHGGEVVVRSMVGLSLTFDHRVVNGAPASRFLQTVADTIAEPSQIEQ